MRRKIQAALVILLVMSVPFAVHHVKPGSVFIFADSFNATMECAGNSIGISASAPATVTAGTPVSITHITSTATVPAGITVNKIVSTINVANASPAVVTGTWTGTGINTVTAPFPDISLTASGAVGSKITLTLASINLYINGGPNPITCDVAAGLLTANKPGESFTILTMGITAPVNPVNTGGGTTTPPSTTPTTSTPKTSTPTVTAPTTTTSSTSAVAATTPTTTTNIAAPAAIAAVEPTKKVIVVVKDSSGHYANNARILIDSLITANTDSKGSATFASITLGKHIVSVTDHKSTIIRSITVDAKQSSLTIAVQMPKVALAAYQISLVAVGAFLVAALTIWGLVDWRKSRAKNNAYAQSFAKVPVSAVTSTYINPEPAVLTSVPIPVIPAAPLAPSAPEPPAIPVQPQIIKPTVQAAAPSVLISRVVAPAQPATVVVQPQVPPHTVVESVSPINQGANPTPTPPLQQPPVNS